MATILEHKPSTFPGIAQDQDVASLNLENLEIKGFCAFQHLRIERLARVNLIVGKNNVGKTNVLEAIRFYSQYENFNSLWEIFNTREEIGFPIARSAHTESEALIDRYLFHNNETVKSRVISIGPIGQSERLLSVHLERFWQRNNTGELVLVKQEDHGKYLLSKPYLYMRLGKSNETFLPLDTPKPQNALSIGEDINTTCVFVRSSGLPKTLMRRWWDRIALTNLEDDVLRAIHIIAPQVRRINLVGNNKPEPARIAAVRIESQTDPIPLSSMGEGMGRLFGIALALVNAKDGFLLVDEIESGIHYSVLPDLWRLVFRVAKELNVQVFATTHSGDCIQAFQEASADDETEGLLIRLENKDGDVKAILFDEEMLETATRRGLEVR